MKAVTLDSIVGVIRARRGQKKFLHKFIEECEIVNAIPIPDNATNGDVIKAMFPNAEIDPDPYKPSVDVYMGGILIMRIDRNLWNAPYKKED